MSVVTVLGTRPLGYTEVRWSCMPSSHNGNSMLLIEKAEQVFSSFLPSPLLISPLSPPYTPHLPVRTERPGSYLQARVRCSWETAHPGIWILDSHLPDHDNMFLLLAPSTVSCSHWLRSHSFLGLWDSWDNKLLVFHCRKSWEHSDKQCYDKVCSPGLCIFRKSLNVGGKIWKVVWFSLVILTNIDLLVWLLLTLSKSLKHLFIYVCVCLIYLRMMHLWKRLDLDCSSP